MTRQRRMIRVGTAAVLAAALLVPGSLEAQQRGPRGMRPQNREQLEQRVRQGFARMLQQRLGLSAEEGQRLGDATRPFMEERAALAREEQALRRRVEALMLEGGEDVAEARGLLERMVALRERELDIVRREQEALLEVLTPVQVLQFLALRDQFNERIRNLRRDRGMRGGGEGRRGVGPGSELPEWGPRGR